MLGVEAQVDVANTIRTMLRMAQCGTIAVEVWQGLMLVLLVQLKRRRAHVGTETCLDESVLGLLLRVLPKALPDAAPVLSTIRPAMRTAMLRPPSSLLQIMDENILAFLPVLVGDVLHGAAPSPEGMEVLRRLSTAVMTSALSVAVNVNEPVPESTRSAGSGSQGSERQQQHVFHDPLQRAITQNDTALEQAAPDEAQRQRGLQQPPPQWMQVPQQSPQQRQCWDESNGVADLQQKSQQPSSPVSDAWVSHGNAGPPLEWDRPPTALTHGLNVAAITGPSNRALAVVEHSPPWASDLSLWPVPVAKGPTQTPLASQDADDTESLGSRFTLSTGFSSGYSRQTRRTIPSAMRVASANNTSPAASMDCRQPGAPQEGRSLFQGRRLDSNPGAHVWQEAIQSLELIQGL